MDKKKVIIVHKQILGAIKVYLGSVSLCTAQANQTQVNILNPKFVCQACVQMFSNFGTANVDMELVSSRSARDNQTQVNILPPKVFVRLAGITRIKYPLRKYVWGSIGVLHTFWRRGSCKVLTRTLLTKIYHLLNTLHHVHVLLCFLF